MAYQHDGSPNHRPSGEERRIERLSMASIDGAPVAYLVSLAAVVAVLALIPIPITFVLGSGRNFPMSQSFYPLAGWLLGPVAGGLADAIGALIGVFIAPHTTTYAPATVLGAALGGLAAGTMAASGRRRLWWIPLLVAFIGFYLWYGGRAVVVNGVQWTSVALGSFINWSSLLLYALPTRTLFARLLRDENLTRVGVGLFGGTWMIAGLVHLATGAVVYTILNYPNEVWLAIAPVAPVEHAFRCIVGTTIGVGVISGLRATGIVKPLHAAY